MRVRFLPVASIIAATVFVAGCSDSDNLFDAIEAEPNVKIQVLHASPDAPRVDVLVDGDAVLEGVDFKQGSAFIPLSDGTYDIAVNAITPGGDVPVIDLAGTPLDADTAYTVIALGLADDLLNAGPKPLQELILANPDVAVGAGNARVQLVHGSPSAPEVSVFATALGADLKQAVPLDTFEFGENSIQQEVPADSYQIRVTLPFDPITEEPVVVFDAGEIPLPDGADLVIVAVDNTTTGDSPITLVVLDGENAAAEILDLATPADVRAVHASPDAPAVDVLVNDVAVLSGVPFTGVSGFLNPSPAPGTYNLKIVDSATGTFEALNINPEFAAGVQYTAIALGLANDIQVDSKILEDDNRSVVTEAKVRVLHGAPSTGNVDIFLTDGPSDINITGLAATIEDVPYRDVRGYLGVAEGSYDIRVTPAGDDQTIAIDKQDIPLVAGCVYTVIARDAEGGFGPLDVILIDECDD